MKGHPKCKCCNKYYTDYASRALMNIIVIGPAVLSSDMTSAYVLYFPATATATARLDPRVKINSGFSLGSKVWRRHFVNKMSSSYFTYCIVATDSVCDMTCEEADQFFSIDNIL